MLGRRWPLPIAAQGLQVFSVLTPEDGKPASWISSVPSAQCATQQNMRHGFSDE
jgi:hypothetical protein